MVERVLSFFFLVITVNLKESLEALVLPQKRYLYQVLHRNIIKCISYLEEALDGLFDVYNVELVGLITHPTLIDKRKRIVGEQFMQLFKEVLDLIQTLLHCPRLVIFLDH